jgi:sRNA-binding regulator protein Hfq
MSLDFGQPDRCNGPGGNLEGGVAVNSDSMIYTIGTALNRARDNDVPVEVLVEGMWIRGDVLAVDGFGVVLHAADEQHSVIRVESISAVTICSAAPHRRTALSDRVHAMPGPRAPSG